MNSAELNGASLGDAFDSSTAVADPAASLPGAIIEVVEGSADFDEVNQAGGIWYGEAPSGTAAPYVVFVRVGDDYSRKDTAGRYFPAEKFRFWAFAREHHAAEGVVQAILDAFNTRSARLGFAGGITLVASPMARGMDMTEYDDDAGERVRIHYVDIEFKTSRSFPNP